MFLVSMIYSMNWIIRMSVLRIVSVIMVLLSEQQANKESEPYRISSDGSDLKTILRSRFQGAHRRSSFGLNPWLMYWLVIERRLDKMENEDD